MQIIDIIQILYIALVIIGLVLLWPKLSEALSKIPNLSHEQRILIIVSTFAVITFAAFYIGLKINDKRQPTIAALPPTTPVVTPSVETTPIVGQIPASPTETPRLISPNIDPANNNLTTPAPISPSQTSPNLDLASFLQINYPTLEQQRTSLQQTITRLNQFFARADQLALQAPRHWRFMQAIALNRWQFLQQLGVLQKRVELELKTFWVFYQNSSSDYTEQEFSKKTTLLTEEIQTLLGKESDVRQRDNKLINNYLGHLVKMLNNPPPTLRQISQQYTPQNRENIMRWLNTSGQTVITDNLSALQDNQHRIEASIKQFKAFLVQFPDTAPQMQTTISLWQQALQANLYAQFRILHAEEAELLFTDSIAKLAPEAGQSLHIAIVDRLSGLISEAADIRIQAERSYKVDKPKASR